MTPNIQLHLLGEFRLIVDNNPVYSLNRPRLQALLAYLLLHRHMPQLRQQIAFRFWPDTSEAQAKTNLRKLLHQLRQVLPCADSLLYIDAQYLGWQPDAPCTVDVVELEQSLKALGSTSDPEVTRVERVMALYRGELLPTCDDEWIFPLRRALHERVVKQLAMAVAGFENQRNYPAGIRCAEYLLGLDPLHEATYTHLMRLYALSGNHSRALRVYHDCVRMLAHELEVAPGHEIQALHAWLRGPAFSMSSTEPTAVSTANERASMQLANEVPLVGRQVEWSTLQQAWNTSHHAPHFVMIWGEAGIGKSRLVTELMHWVQPRAGTLAHTRSYAAKGALTYAPVTEWLRSATMRPTLHRLEEVWLAELVRLLPELRVEHPSLPQPLPMTEGWQRQRLFEALSRAVLVAPRPLILVLDDLQWCDAETLAWLRYLLRADLHVPLLLVGAARVEEVDEQHPLSELLWYLRREKRYSEIRLMPLNVDETTTLARHIAGHEVLPAAEVLYRETEGNPLFVIETVRATMLEVTLKPEGNRARSLPATVKAVIAARLAQLSPQARQLAQLAGTIGQAFSFELVAAASDMAEAQVVQGVDELWQRYIIREQRSGYDFSHDKIREVAYGEISQARRKYLHRKVAQALETLHSSHLDDVSGQLAIHYEQAGQIERAIAYYRQAAAAAQRLYANAEAIKCIQRALHLLFSMPETPPHLEEEFVLQQMLGFALGLSRGYASPACAEAYQRALALGQRIGKSVELSGLRYTLWRYHFTRSEFAAAQALAEELLDQAQRTNNDSLLSYAQHALGATFLYAGNVLLAHDYLEQSLANTDHAESDQMLLQLQNPRVVSTSYDAFALWYLGYPDQALQRCHHALALAKGLGRPINQASAYMMAAWVHQCRGEAHLVQERAQAGLDLSHQYDLLYWRLVGQLLHGWAKVAQHQTEASLVQMRESVQHFQSTGAALYLPYYLALVADACRMLDRLDEGLHLVDEALAIVERRNERQWESPLYWLQGELLLAQLGPVSEVERAYNRSLETARRQRAKSVELRAALSLGRLWAKQGKRVLAQSLLSGVYSGFSEGFDTVELQVAKALLEGWSEPDD